MITLKNIISILDQFATDQSQVTEILRGTPYDVDETQQVNGVQMLWSLDSLSANGESGISYNLTAFFMEQVTEVNNPTNTESVMNECILICTDLVNYLEAYNYTAFEDTDKNLNVQLDKTWFINPFEERFNSIYSGAFVTFSLQSNYNYNRCLIPILVDGDGIGYFEIGNTFII